MIRAIVFDFDGVIIESTQVKTEAFRMLFSQWPEKIEEILSYHRNNMGISRFVKFKYIFEEVLKIPYSEKLGSELGKRFSELVIEKVKNAPFVDGAKEFLERNHNMYSMFIASGTPQKELEDIISFRGLDVYFKAVFGAPLTKGEIIRDIIKRCTLLPCEMVFVGDAKTDKEAAEEVGIPFVLRKSPETDMENARYEVSDMNGLEAIIERMGICR